MALRKIHHRFCCQFKLLTYSAFGFLLFFFGLILDIHCFTLSVRMSTIINCFNNLKIELATSAVIET